MTAYQAKQRKTEEERELLKQKQELAHITGMAVKQIVHWMSNVRKRRLLPLLGGRRSATSAVDVKFLGK